VQRFASWNQKMRMPSCTWAKSNALRSLDKNKGRAGRDGRTSYGGDAVFQIVEVMRPCIH